MKNYLVLDENLTVFIGPESKNWSCSNQDWFFIYKGYWFIEKGVVWDGATLVPDGKEDPTKPGFPILWLATLIHDLGYYGWSESEDFPYTRKEIDKIFLKLMKEKDFKFAWLYYWGVRVFGRVWTKITDWGRKALNFPRFLPTHIDEL